MTSFVYNHSFLKQQLTTFSNTLSEASDLIENSSDVTISKINAIRKKLAILQDGSDLLSQHFNNLLPTRSKTIRMQESLERKKNLLTELSTRNPKDLVKIDDCKNEIKRIRKYLKEVPDNANATNWKMSREVSLHGSEGSLRQFRRLSAKYNKLIKILDKINTLSNLISVENTDQLSIRFNKDGSVKKVEKK